MPTYEYVCEACGHAFERFQKMSEKPLKRCPSCGENRAERKISAGGGLVFKGPGFYATDYRKGPAPSTDGKGEQAAAGDGGDAAGGSSKASEGTSDGPSGGDADA